MMGETVSIRQMFPDLGLDLSPSLNPRVRVFSWPVFREERIDKIVRERESRIDRRCPVKHDRRPLFGASENRMGHLEEDGLQISPTRYCLANSGVELSLVLRSGKIGV
jgi:hypothetical protein